MTKLGVNVKNAQTNCVSLGSKALQEYFKSNQIFENSGETRIYFGIYSAYAPKIYQGAKPGRLTTIIWPCKVGQPVTYPSEELGDRKDINPFNLGEL